MSDYEQRRLANIERNRALVQELGLEYAQLAAVHNKRRPPKRRKVESTGPLRSSSRIASAITRPVYNENSGTDRPNHTRRRHRAISNTSTPRSSIAPAAPRTYVDVATISAGWSSWAPVAPPPTRDVHGTFHFASHATFTPNKSPEEILREGCFGGAYFRPLRSAALGGVVIADDWRELPSVWLTGLNIARAVASPTYDPAINKFGVSCGQSIEAWEAAGWIAHEHDVRGWFQWYCRFYMGRRCADDDRQVGRWLRCVGENGRWRRALLNKYVAAGMRSAFDDDESDESNARDAVSPVVHQTCHHWAYEVRQEALDRFWAEGR